MCWPPSQASLEKRRPAATGCVRMRKIIGNLFIVKLKFFIILNEHTGKNTMYTYTELYVHV